MEIQTGRVKSVHFIDEVPTFVINLISTGHSASSSDLDKELSAKYMGGGSNDFSSMAVSRLIILLRRLSLT